MVPPVRLVIEMTQAGVVTVTGPVESKVVCYAMIELARDAIKDHKPSLIQPASAAPQVKTT